MWEMIFFYIAAVNVLTFSLFGVDKYKAKRRKWRISEKTLLLFAAIGGSPGALAGMGVFHHKTKKAKFALGVPVMLLLQAAWLAGGYYFMMGK